MIISHKYKFIFIKTLKTAGTSIEMYLSPLCSNDDVVTPIGSDPEGHNPRNHDELFFSHIQAKDARLLLSRQIWDNYYKFCVERNPWDKTLSHFFWKKHKKDKDLSLDDYFRQGLYCENWPKYCDWGTRESIVDRIIHYDNLNDELGEVFQRLGVPYEGSLTIRAKSGVRADDRHYREIFTEAQKQKVAEIYNKEINMHGYQY